MNLSKYSIYWSIIIIDQNKANAKTRKNLSKLGFSQMSDKIFTRHNPNEFSAKENQVKCIELLVSYSGKSFLINNFQFSSIQILFDGYISNFETSINYGTICTGNNKTVIIPMTSKQFEEIIIF
jgi:hypothetical protein